MDSDKNESAMSPQLASMSSRLAAYMIDMVLVVAVVVGLAAVLVGVSGLWIYLLAALLFGSDVFSAIFLWVSNGYTPGKWLMHIRVAKTNGERLKLTDALLREVLIKGLANSVVYSLLNIGSFLWGYLTLDHKTVHDLVTKTKVVGKKVYRSCGG